MTEPSPQTLDAAAAAHEQYVHTRARHSQEIHTAESERAHAFVEALTSGHMAVDVAKATGLNKSNVARIARSDNGGDPKLKLSHNRGRKVPPEVVTAIRVKRNQGAVQSELAREYGLSEGYIGRIIYGDVRKDIPGPIQTRKPKTPNEDAA